MARTLHNPLLIPEQKLLLQSQRGQKLARAPESIDLNPLGMIGFGASAEHPRLPPLPRLRGSTQKSPYPQISDKALGTWFDFSVQSQVGNWQKSAPELSDIPACEAHRQWFEIPRSSPWHVEWTVNGGSLDLPIILLS
ncbi:hypothetical protein BO71DRAFT_405733 [Aspergillus ellipticus CBS 707.79]|uniref:Uncharacterized protein n=1 Tax=Aspergillus ellipticus CBS 707.79 TaxID=1448320 RepID=A0A319DNJ0_9EURO|nr:hypothetical protein BO71DRAFT_405733 [Aspergillus ellipticus CBS 707.79]